MPSSDPAAPSSAGAPWLDYAPPASPAPPPSLAGANDGPWSDYAPAKPLTVTPAATPAPADAAPQGPLTNNGDEGWISGAAKGLGTAAVRGASMMAGLPGDLDNLSKMATAGVDKLVRGGSYSDALQRVNAAEAAQQQHSRDTLGVAVPTAPDSQDVETGIENKTGIGRYDPSTAVGRIAQAGASAVMGGAVAPGAATAELGQAGIRGLVKTAAADALPNAVAGASAQTAAEATQNKSRGTSTAAQLVAGLAGGMAGGAMRNVAHRYTPAGRDAAVGADLLRSSSNPDAVRSTLTGDTPAALVPGSAPTTAELTGDAGLSVLQDRAATRDPATWNAREDANNTARVSALQSTAPADADAMAPARTFSDHLDAIQAAGQQVRDDMTAAHEAAVKRLSDAYSDDAAIRSQAGADFSDQQRTDLTDRMAGRQDDLAAVTAAQQSQQQSQRDALTQAFADRISAAQQAATDGNARLGPAMPQDVAGQVLRDHLQAAADEEKARTTALYKAVDPDNSLFAVATPAKAAVRDIRSGIDPIAGVQPSGVEADLHDAIRSMPDVVPFSSLQALDSRVGAAMADARRNPSAADPQALSRLTQLKGATMDAINNAVDHQHNYEQDRVAAGALDPADTVRSRLDDLATQLSGDPQRGAGRAVGLSGGDAGAGADAFPGMGGTGVTASGRPSPVAGMSSVSDAPPFNPDRLTRPVPPSEPRPHSLHDFVRERGGVRDVGGEPSPNMAESGAAERLAAAKAQHQISAAYKASPVGEALKSAGYKGTYRLAPEGVARAAVRDYTSAKAFLDGAKRAPEAVGHIGEIVTNDLRRRVSPTGEVSATALSQWEQQNAGAIRALREVDPTFGRGFHEAAKANDALVALGQERAATLKQFELDAAARGADAFSAGRDNLRAANAADRASTAKSIADRRAADLQADREARGTRDAGIADSKAETGATMRAVDDVVARARKLPGAELAGKTDPSEVSRFMGRLVEDKASGPTRARSFMASIAHDDAAVAGARKALVDHVVGRLENRAVTSAGDRALSGPKLRTYLADHAAALSAIMPKEHLDSWNAVAADMARRDASRAAARTTNSATASRLLPAIDKAAKAAAHGGHGAGGAAWVLALDAMMEHGLSLHSLGLAAAPLALGMAKKTAGAVLGREKRIRAGLLTEALLNPDVARHYVRALGHDNPTAGAALVNTLRRGFTAAQAVR